MGLAFDELLRQHLILYVAILFFVMIVYIFILRKQLFSLFDPMMFSILQAAGAFTTNILLKVYGLIEDSFFISFILSEIAFLVGFLIIKRKRKIEYKKIKNEKEFSNKRDILFFICSMMYIVLQLYFYYKNGIPLFRNTEMISLLELELASGPVKKILYVLVPVISVCCIDFFIREKNKTILCKWMYYTMFYFIIVSLILSGWKSNMLIIVFLFALYIVFIYGEKTEKNITEIKKLNRRLIKLSIFALIAMFIIITVSYIGKEGESPLYYFIKRVSLSGDIFVYTYTRTDLLELVDKGNYFANLVAGTFLGKIIRIYSPNSIVKSIGVQVYQLAIGSNTIAGPNPRHNFIGLLYFGTMGGIVYSFIIGIFTAYVRKCFYEKAERSIYKTILFCSVVYYVSYAHIDITSLFINYVYYFMIVMIPIFCVNEIIYKVAVRKG